MKNRKSIIVGLKSTVLSKQEKFFLKKEKPWGIILFSRNINNFKQTKKLVSQIKSCFNDKHYPILIDEEGGRISRIKKIINTNDFPPSFFGNMYKKNKKDFFLHYTIYINSISAILKSIGININTVPLLDVVKSKKNKIIGDRSYSNNPHIVSKVGDFCINKFSKNKIATVIKHIPGHGITDIDSHYYTPIVNKDRKTLNNIDFFPFKNKKSLLAMTAHVIYKNYDLHNTTTHSKIIINKVIRKKIKFKNILISDDISMKSLKYNFKTNVLKAFEAGCNIVLHCNGNMREMKTLAEISPKIDNFVYKKTSQLYNFLM
tara:strand:- start:176 stop:1126 length:951 start_codon:yes stop_codon:yes gene_type:complete